MALSVRALVVAQLYVLCSEVTDKMREQHIVATEKPKLNEHQEALFELADKIVTDMGQHFSNDALRGVISLVSAFTGQYDVGKALVSKHKLVNDNESEIKHIYDPFTICEVVNAGDNLTIPAGSLIMVTHSIKRQYWDRNGKYYSSYIYNYYNRDESQLRVATDAQVKEYCVGISPEQLKAFFTIPQFASLADVIMNGTEETNEEADNKATE